MRDLFHKQFECQNCGILLHKKQLSIYDSTHQGRYKTGRIAEVCNSCLMELFYRDLLNLKESAVVISPIDRCNAYVSYSFETLLNTKQRTPSIKINTERFINDLIELLPKNNSKCSCCENKASYTWCSSELFKNNDPFEWVAEKDARFESTYYCKECLIRIFQMKIAEGNIKFEFVYPPIEGKGFLCSWEV